MNNTRKKWIPLLTLGSALCLANASWAQNITWQGNVGNFNVGSNWVGNVVPGAGNTAIIGQNNAVVTLNTTNTITALSLALNVANNTSSMLIDTAGNLTISGTGNNLWIAQQATASPTGTLTVKGALSYNGHVQMSTFVNAGFTPSSSLIIDGGSAFIDNNLQMTVGNDTSPSTSASATLTLKNGGSLTGLNNIDTGNGINTFNLSLNSTGITNIGISSAFTLGAGSNILNLDLSSYDISNGTSMNLFTYATRSGFWDSVNIDGLDLGSIFLTSNSSTFFETPSWKGNFVVGGTSLSLSGLEFIPEPTSALAGLLLTAGLLRRRRTA
jgi:hypothetical protein